MWRYTHPELYVLLRHWPATVLLPLVLVLIAVLALITRRWDQRDLERLQETSPVEDISGRTAEVP